MINTKDIMPGDHILVKGKPQRIEEIRRFGVGYYPTPACQRLSYSSVHVCEHILVTADWLLGHGFILHQPQPGFDYDFRDVRLTISLYRSDEMSVRIKLRCMGGYTKLSATGLKPTVSCLHQILKIHGEEDLFNSLIKKNTTYESTIQED